MSLLLGDLMVRYRADVTDLTVKTAMADAAITSTAATARAADSSMGNLSGATKFGKIFAGAMLLAGAAAVGLGALSVKMAADFEQSTNLLITSAGETQQNIGMIRSGLLQMSIDTATSTSDLVKGMFNIESAGYHGAEALMIEKAAAEGAKVENADLAAVTDVLTTSMHNYNLPASQAVDTMNSFRMSASIGKMRMDDLTGALKNVLPIASQAGVSLTNVEAALSTMSLAGDKGASAGTHLSQMLTYLLAPSSKATKALQTVGLTTQQISDEMKVSLPGTVQMITDAVGEKFPVGSAKYIAALSAIVGGNKSMKAMLELSGVSLKTFTQDASMLGPTMKANSTAVDGWNVVQGNFNFKMDAAKNAVSALMITAGTQLLPVIGDLLTKITPTITSFTKWLMEGDRLKNTMTQVAGAISGFISTVSAIVGFFQQNQLAFALLTVGVIALAGVIGGLLVASLVATAVAAWAAMVPLLPFIAIGALVALVIAGIVIAVMHWGEIAHWLQGVWGALVGWLGGVWNGFASWFMGILHSIGSFFVGVWNGIKGATTSAWNFLVDIVKQGAHFLYLAIFGPILAIVALFQWLYNHNYYFKDLVDSIVGFFTGAFKWLTDQWNTITGWLGDKWKSIKDTASNIFGSVTGTVSSKTKEATSGLQSAWNSVAGWLGDKFNWFIDLNKQTWQMISNVAGMLWSKYLQPPLQGAWNSIQSFLGGWPTQAFQAGVNFINMLVSGITSGAGAIWNAVSGIAKNIWSALGFHSPPEAGPAKDADTWMPNLIKMLVSGLNAGIPQIKTASQQVAAPLQGQFAYPIKPSAVAVAAASQNASSSSSQGQTIILEIDGHRMAHVVNVATDRTVRLKLGAQGRAA